MLPKHRVILEGVIEDATKEVPRSTNAQIRARVTEEARTLNSPKVSDEDLRRLFREKQLLD